MERIPLEINGARVVLTRSRGRRRTVSLAVRAPDRISVRAPGHVPESAIAAFLQKRQSWIRRQICRHEEARSFCLGLAQTRSWPFLGKTREHPDTTLSLERWYRREATAYLKERTRAFAQQMLLPAPRLKITCARHRWGSCSANNILSFPWRLVMLPPDVIDYIVVHELAHIREKNHGPRFWRCVSQTLPSHAIHRQWLKNNQHLFSGLTHEQAQA